MRIILLTCLALTVTGCASDRPKFRGPGDGHGGPGMGHGGPGMRAEAGPPGRLFISPMGEPFRTERGQGDPDDLWFKAADTNGDGKLSPDEFAHDAARFFAVLDRGHDGEIDPDDIEYYETVLVPEIRVSGADGPARGGRGGGGGGGRRRSWRRRRRRHGRRRHGRWRHGGAAVAAADHSKPTTARAAARSSGPPAGRAPRATAISIIPEPVTAADTNLNRGVSPEEFDQAATKRFALLDKNGDGFLERDELPRVSGPSRPSGMVGHRPPAAQDQ